MHVFCTIYTVLSLFCPWNYPPIVHLQNTLPSMTVLSTLTGSSKRRRLALVVPVLLALFSLQRALSPQLSSLRRSRSFALNTPQIEEAIRDLFSYSPEGLRKLSLVDSRGRPHTVTITPTSKATFRAHRPHFLPSTPQSSSKVGVNAEFIRQLVAIFRIIVPSFASKETALFALHTFFLVLRTYLSLLLARLDGVIVREIVSANGRGFAWGLVYWFGLAIPSTYANSMIRFLQQKLAISFRTRLTRYVHDLYLSDKHIFYQAINLDNRIESADQFITTDISKFCNSLSSLYSNVAKPVLDILIFNAQLAGKVGGWGAFGLFCNYIITARIIRSVTPAFGKLAAVENKLEGDFRNVHTRIITNAEEIAFYNGSFIEMDMLNRTYMRLVKHINSIFKIRIAYGMTEDFVMKYAWSAAGYFLISVPVFFGNTISKAKRGVQSNIATRTEGSYKDYISNRRLLLALADAGSRLMYSYKGLAELAGYTSRVYTLLSTLHALDAKQYLSTSRPQELSGDFPVYDLGHINGVVSDGFPDVEFEKVPIVAPAPGSARGGEELVANLSMTVKPGEHLLVTGPNGVGKTGLVRVLAGLWPTFEGVVRRPDIEDILFLPQRPYLSLGNLRDQIIYPHTFSQMQEWGYYDEDLLDILEHVHLEYLPAREGGLDTVKEWKDVLSGGEKQRMGMARLFYHKPRYGILDECTSAVSSDVEGLIYQHAKDLKITLITVSHRPSLTKYHQYLLRLTGEDGAWGMTTVGTEQEQMTTDREIDAIEERLRNVDNWKRRLKEIEGEMAFTRG